MKVPIFWIWIAVQTLEEENETQVGENLKNPPPQSYYC